MVIWIIGLSGAGKTTLANEVIAQVRRVQQNVVLLDGDVVRNIFDNDIGYSVEDRRVNAQRISQLCKFLDDQGIDVVCAILSLFPESRTWNRKEILNYYEVFIDTPIEDLIQRDAKGIYRRFKSGEISDVAGMDIKFPYPSSANLVINNVTSKEFLLDHAKDIVEKIIGVIR